MPNLILGRHIRMTALLFAVAGGFMILIMQSRAQDAGAGTPNLSDPDAWQVPPWKLADKNPYQDGALMFYVSGADNTDGNVELIISGGGLIAPAPKPIGIDDGGKPHNFVLISTTNSGAATMLVYHLETPDRTGFKIEQVGVPADQDDVIKNKYLKTKADMRSMATALEAYYVDCNSYPAWTANVALSIHAGPAQAAGSPGWSLPAFRLGVPGANGTLSPFTLTTPISYITSFYDDPFANQKGHTFQYYATGQSANTTSTGWILWSPGPDGKYDLDWSQYDPNTSDS